MEDPDEVAARMVRLATDGVIACADGTDIEVDARSICTHGDSPGAVAMAAAVAEGLRKAGVTVRAFVTETAPALAPDA